MPTFPPLHDDLTFLAPLSEERAARLVAFLTEPSPATVLDVGCGWGELLLRVLEAAPSATGLGVDLDEESLGAAREGAARGGPRGAGGAGGAGGRPRRGAAGRAGWAGGTPRPAPARDARGPRRQ